jgi:hypothetical protein
MRDATTDKKKQYNGLSEASLSKQESFFQQLLLVASTLLGVIIALRSTNLQPLCIRLVFLLALVLLSLGILATLIVVFDLIRIREGAPKAYLGEWHSAVQEDRPMDPLRFDLRKRTRLCRKAALAGFVLGVLVLTSYSVLLLFV